MDTARYDHIGQHYANKRRQDPYLAARINKALSDCRTIVNLGAGAGSYEPTDRFVLAIEPSDVMAAQRPPHLAPALRLSAGPLPLRDHSIDAAMAILTIHHWGDRQELGVRELRRVARGPVIIVTYDIDVTAAMWLYRDYMPEAAAMDHEVFPTIAQLVSWLGGSVDVEVISTAHDTPDRNLASFWAHPERVLDPAARQATSAFTLLKPEVVERVVESVAADLAGGAWDQRHGHLRDLATLDVGMRLLVAHPVP